ncbi:MAG: adenine deaminase [Candidatus Marinimicrobia bacterium]|nr:adenine deaminase [Candidatus Neomarinimicrobiota bacterium]
MSYNFIVSGNIVDVLNNRIFSGKIHVKNGRIRQILQEDVDSDVYILPGFIDSHVHIESSMLIPSEFARIAVTHGTVAVVADPHEIANVLGVNGVKYMIENGKNSPLKFYFSAPSCVPATTFETSGAVLGVKEIEQLLKMDEIKYLGEFMNYPGVLNEDSEVVEKLKVAKKYSKKIDGHAPGLRGEDARKYAEAGISTDHECTTYEEALEKINFGMKIQIREGSACKDFDTLFPLTEEHFNNCLFCCDDLHPDDLIKGHLNTIVKKALDSGLEIMKALKIACVNPVQHYGLDVGLLQVNDPADFIIVDNLSDFTVLKTYVDGKLIAENGKTKIPYRRVDSINHFQTQEKRVEDFAVPAEKGRIKVIQATDGQVVTKCVHHSPEIKNENVVSNLKRDILKIAVANRYADAKPATGFIQNFGLKKGAIASSVAHDSHNIIAVGTSDYELCKAVNVIIKNQGGLCVVAEEFEEVLPLPIAGIMTSENSYEVADKYAKLDKLAKSFGSTLSAPFMTLSFMALLVIPELKLSDKGLFDGNNFTFVSLFE